MPGAMEVNQTGQRQDIADIVSNIRAEETPIMSMIPKRPRPLQKVTQFQMEAYPDAAITGIMDGEDVSSFDHTPRVLGEAVAQKFRRPWKVSDFADVTQVAGLPSGEKGRQKAVAAIVLKFMLEGRILSNADCSIDNGTDTPNETRGAVSWLSTSAQDVKPVNASFRPASDTQYTGTLGDFTETAFENILAACYKIRHAKLKLDLVLGVDLKKKFDNFTARDAEATATNVPVRTFNQNAKDKAMIKVVDVLEFSTAMVRLHLSTFIGLTEATGAASDYTHRSGIGFDLEQWRMGYMRAPGMKELEDQGGGPRGFADTIAVLECRNPLAQPLIWISSDS